MKVRKTAVAGGTAATPTVAEDAPPSTESNISVAVKAFRDGYLDHGEQAAIVGRAANETDGATKAFLDTVAGYGAKNIKTEQTASTQAHRAKLLTRVRVLFGMDPKDPVLGGAPVSMRALNTGVVKAWVKTGYDVDQPAARAKFETLLTAGNFYDAAVAGANLQHRGPALLALAIASKSSDEAAGVASLLHAGKSLSDGERKEIILALLKNPVTGTEEAVGAIEYGSGPIDTQDSNELKNGLYEVLVRSHPTDPEVLETALHQLHDAATWADDLPVSTASLARSLLESGASMREVLIALQPRMEVDFPPAVEHQIDLLIATLVTDVAAKTPAGLQDAKAAFEDAGSAPWGPLANAAAIKVGVLPPPAAKVSPEPTTW